MVRFCKGGTWEGLREGVTERAIRPCLATYSSPLQHCQKDTEGWSGVGCPGCLSGNDSSLVIDKGERGASVSVRYRALFGLPIDYVRVSLSLTERAEGGIESLTQCSAVCLSMDASVCGQSVFLLMRRGE